MHMTSQKGAPACWRSNEALPRAPSPSMQPAGQPLHAIPPGWPGPAHWLRGWERQRALPAQHVRAARQVLTPNMASLLWRRDVNAIGLLPEVCRSVLFGPPCILWIFMFFEFSFSTKSFCLVCIYWVLQLWTIRCVQLYYEKKERKEEQRWQG